MPGYITHCLFGIQACRRIKDPALKKSICRNRAVYFLGLQGPDILFYDIASSLFARKNPGSTAHTEDTGKFLKHLLESPKIFPAKKERQIAQIYVLGYIGHYLLDTACHPYIYAMTHDGRHPKGYIGKHLLLEAEIDAALLLRCRSSLPNGFRKSGFPSLSKKERRTAAAALYFAFSRTYPGIFVTKRRILHAIHAMQAAAKLLHNPDGQKKSIRSDPCNLKKRPWTNPWDETRRSNESFFSLFKTALESYVKILNERNDFFTSDSPPEVSEEAMRKLLASLGNLCCHSGLPSAPYVP